jgi:hypothetical protein
LIDSIVPAAILGINAMQTLAIQLTNGLQFHEQQRTGQHNLFLAFIEFSSEGR